MGLIISTSLGTDFDIHNNTISGRGGVIVYGSSLDGTFSNNEIDPNSFTGITWVGSNNTISGAGNTLLSGSACGGSGVNPASNIEFVDGAHCP